MIYLMILIFKSDLQYKLSIEHFPPLNMSAGTETENKSAGTETKGTQGNKLEEDILFSFHLFVIYDSVFIIFLNEYILLL